MAAESWTDRLRLMVGEAGLERLASARVVVFGVGGVGSNCAEALVRGGVGNLVFVDGDAVQPSNINRQSVAYPQTIGKRKVEVMRQLAEAINPQVCIQPIDMFVTRENADEVFARIIAQITSAEGSCALDSAAGNVVAAGVLAADVVPDGAEIADGGFADITDGDVIAAGVENERIDFVVDAIDTVSSKLAIIEAAQRRGIPVISSMGGANKSDPTQFRFADIYETSVCPLAKAVRKLAREAGLEGFPVLYSRETPHNVSRGTDKAGMKTSEVASSFEASSSLPAGLDYVSSCSAQGAGVDVSSLLDDTNCATDGISMSSGRVLGTMSYIPPIMGYMIAGYVIEHLLANSQG